jgi:hypothetical protein
LTPDDHRRIVDECYYCKLCFNHCPYTPPHQYEIDFPHLMIAGKRQLALERGVSWRDRWLNRTDLLGTIGSWTAPLSRYCIFPAKRFRAGSPSGRCLPARLPRKWPCFLPVS